MSFKNLISQVKWNCQVASAGQAGQYSLCGTLLRLRQLYKWEHGLLPWQEPDPQAVLAWIEMRERAWDTLEGQAWRDLTWDAAVFDPFAVEALNDRLLPQGLAYGAGLSRGLAPTFFLGELVEVRRQEGVTILVLGEELARDLDGTPALCQGRLIYARKQTLTYYLWDRLSDPIQQNNPFLKVALNAYRLPLKSLLQQPQDYQEPFAALLAAELEAAIHHEMGEALEPSLRVAFPAILELYPQTRVELWVRALKDALAEVNERGRLSHLIKERNLPSLALMLAWRPGLYSLLLPELEPAFGEVAATDNWQVMEQARQQALDRLRRVAGGLNTLLQSREGAPPLKTLREIESQYLAPLGELRGHHT
jgi:hypothetical protein